MELEWPLILFTFFLCIAGGTLAMQGVLSLLGRGKKMQLISLIVSMGALAVGGIAVFTHLQHWERIFNGFGHITSGITLEMIVCVVFAVVVVLDFLMMRRAEDGMIPKWCGVLCIIVGLAVAVITGDSYLMASLPSWDTPLLLVYYASNVILWGGIIGMIIGYFTKCEDSHDIAVKVALAGGILQVLVVVAYAVYISGSIDMYGTVEYYFDPTLPDVAMVDVAGEINIIAGALAPLYWLVVVVLGGAGPIVLSALCMKAEGQKRMIFAIAALVCALIGGMVWRGILYEVALSVFPMF